MLPACMQPSRHQAPRLRSTSNHGPAATLPTHCRVLSVQPFLNATKLSLSLFCNTTATPWCQPEAISSRQTRVRHAAAVHAVSGS